MAPFSTFSKGLTGKLDRLSEWPYTRGLTQADQKAIEHGFKVVEARLVEKLDYVAVVLFGKEGKSCRIDVRGSSKERMIAALEAAIEKIRGGG